MPAGTGVWRVRGLGQGKQTQRCGLSPSAMRQTVSPLTGQLQCVCQLSLACRPRAAVATMAPLITTAQAASAAAFHRLTTQGHSTCKLPLTVAAATAQVRLGRTSWFSLAVVYQARRRWLPFEGLLQMERAAA